MASKTAFLTPKRRKKSRAIISNAHYWLICYKGDVDMSRARPFFIMDKTATMKNSVLMGNPVIPAHYRLVDKEGLILNPYEKHMGEVVEQLARFVPRDGVVADFCCGTGSAGLAALYMNQAFCILNDRDSKVLPFAEARLRAYLWVMMRSPAWLPDEDGEYNSQYHISGYDVRHKWDGQDMYEPLLAALKVKIKPDKVMVVQHNTPRCVKKEEFAGLFDCVLGPNDDLGITEPGVYVTTSLPKGTQFPLFGAYKRRCREPPPNEISYVVLRPCRGETKPFFLKVSSECPFRFVRNPALPDPSAEDGEESDEEPRKPRKANCSVVEMKCGMDQICKVVLELTEDIVMEDDGDEYVELLCKYDVHKSTDGWKAHVPRAPSPRKKKKPTAAANTDKDEDEDPDKEDAAGDEAEGDVDADVEEDSPVDEDGDDGDDDYDPEND